MEVFGMLLDAPLRPVEHMQVRQRGIAAQQNKDGRSSPCFLPLSCQDAGDREGPPHAARSTRLRVRAAR